MEIHPIRLPEAVSTIDANYISSARLLQTPKLLPNRQFWFDDSRYLPANAMIYLAFRGSQETHVELPLKRCLIASEPYASNSRPAEFQTSADNPRGELGIFHAPSQLGLGTVSQFCGIAPFLPLLLPHCRGRKFCNTISLKFLQYGLRWDNPEILRYHTYGN